MSFKSTDLMIDLMPDGINAQPGLVLCGQVTAGGLDEDEDDKDEDDLQCGQVTATGNEPTSAAAGMELALLRRQLGEALAARSFR